MIGRRSIALSCLGLGALAAAALLVTAPDRGAGPVPPPEPGLPGERVGPRTLEILTWNLQWFPGNQQASDAAAEERHLEAVAGELRRAAPDILCLQEVKGEAGIDRLLARLPGYRMQVVSDFRGAQEVAILSRIDAITAYAEEFRAAAEKPPRGFAHAAFEVGTGRLLVYSVHLKSNVGGIGANIPVREESARQLLRHAEEARSLHLANGARAVSVVLAGDFNTSLAAEPFRADRTAPMILEAGYRWGFDGLPPGEVVTWLSDGRYPDAAFDHFFVRQPTPLGLESARILPTDRTVSDHRPVVMRIALPER